jgi:CRP-like cAMP-binding protein
LFSRCSARELRQADRYCTFLDVTNGQVLARRGQQPGQLVVVLSGYAHAIQSDGAVRLLAPGDHFGSVAECDDDHVTVTATTDATIVAASQSEMSGLLRACPGVGDALVRLHRRDDHLDLVAEELAELTEANNQQPSSFDPASYGQMAPRVS